MGERWPYRPARRTHGPAPMSPGPRAWDDPPIGASPKAAPSWSGWTVPSAPWTRSRLPTCSPARSLADPDCLRSPQRAAAESSVRGRLRAAPARRRRADLHHSPRAAPVRVRATHGARRRGVAGGTGERLLSGASAPVAVAPAAYADALGSLRTLGCGFDGSPESERALHWAAALARRASARVARRGRARAGSTGERVGDRGAADRDREPGSSPAASRAARRGPFRPRAGRRGERRAERRLSGARAPGAERRARPAGARLARLRAASSGAAWKRLQRAGPLGRVARGSRSPRRGLSV